VSLLDLKRALGRRLTRALGIAYIDERIAGTEVLGREIRDMIARLERSIVDAKQRSANEHAATREAIEDIYERLEQVARQQDQFNIQLNDQLSNAENLEANLVIKNGTGQPLFRQLPFEPAQRNFPAYFIVTSFGLAGTKWFAKALNMHPDILCSHGLCHPALGIIYDREFTAEEWTRIADEEVARRGMSTDAMFGELKSTGEAKVYGSVHHYRTGELESALKAHPAAKRFRCADLIRHPLLMVLSKYGANTSDEDRNDKQHLINFANAADYLSKTGNADDMARTFSIDLNFLADIVTRHYKWNLNLSDHRQAMFLEALHITGGMVRNVQRYQSQPLLLMERLTTDRDYFRLAFDYLMDGKLSVSGQYLDKVFSLQPTNRHRSENAFKSPLAVFEGLESWQRAMYDAFLEHFQVADTFVPLGYEIPGAS